MKNNTGKILLTQALASVLIFASLASACDNSEPYVEDGTTVVFDYNDTDANGNKSRDYSMIIDEGEKIEEAPETPIREGYEFSHWQTAKDGGEQITFPYEPSSDVTIYAAWKAQMLDVTFDMNFSGSTPIVTEVEYGSTVSAPTADQIPERNGYEFFEWQNAPENGVSIEFPYTVKKDITFYASWASAGIYYITFDINYDSDVEYPVENIKAGEKLLAKDAPSNPERDGWRFKGWATSPDASASEVIKFPYVPTSSQTLYAIWEERTYTVQFRYNYVGKPSVQFGTPISGLRSGDVVEAPATNPEREGHTFDGWWTTAQGGTQIQFPVNVETDTIYYAHWKSDAVETDTFHAEFTYIDPLQVLPGYSGSAQGAGIIINEDTTGIIHTQDDYPTNSAYSTSEGHYVTYLYKRGATVTFEIYASAAVSGVTLQANLAYEWATNPVVGPSGVAGVSAAWDVKVNGTAINYSPISFTDPLDGNNKSVFKMYTLSTTVSLVEGKNVIELVTENDNALMGGTTMAYAPMVDCIKLTNTGAVVLTYHPIYDNLWYGSLG